MAIDDVLDRARDARRRRDEAAGELVALGDREAEIIRVAVPGDPHVGQGEMVAVDALTAQPWEMEGRSGMAFRCAAIRSAAGRSSGEKAAA